MKHFLNTLLTALLLISFVNGAKSQAIDMALISPTIQPSPASYPGTASIGFKVLAEILDQPLSSNTAGISSATITIALGNLQGSTVNIPTGDGAELFTWFYNAAQNTYIGTSRDVTMVADVQYSITLSNLPIIQASTAFNTGFLANLTPPGDLWVSETNDDAVRIYVPAPLPVTLVSFNVQKEGQLSVLNWATTEETNSDFFEVQHSVNGKVWNAIDKVIATGESSSLRNYSFTHRQPSNGENMYRLRMVDKDQTFAFSSIKSVMFNGIDQDYSVYPNPSSDFIRLRDAENILKVSILDLTGKTVYQSSKLSAGEISVKSLATGMYSVRIERRDGAQTVQKLVVAR